MCFGHRQLGKHVLFIIVFHIEKLWAPLDVVLYGLNRSFHPQITGACERNGKNLFWSIKNAGQILTKLRSRGFLASGLSTYDFSTLYTTLPLNLIKEKLTELIEQTFNREGSLYLAFNDKMPFYF